MMSDTPKIFRELGVKKGNVLERFTKLQRTVMPLSKRTRLEAKYMLL